MNNIAINQILILIIQCLIVGSLLLFLFRLRTIFGLGLIFTALGVFQYMQVFLAASLYIEIIPGVLVTPGSMVMFTGSLFAILLIYIREDALEARKVIYALLAANLILSLLQIIFSWAIEGEHVINIYNFPKELFLVNSRVLLVGTLVLFIDAFLVIFIYEAISRFISPLVLRILFSMALIISFDSLAFSIGAFAGTTQFSNILISGLISKLSSTIIYSGLFSIYLLYIDKDSTERISDSKAFNDIFHLLTYRQKYEQAYKEMKTQETELQKIETRFKSLIEQIGDAMFLADLEGHIIDVNNYACESLGYTKSELLSLKVRDLDHGFFKQDDQKNIWNQLKPGIPVTIESIHKRKDGSLFPVEIRIGIIESEKHKSIIGIARDISERKKAEAEIKDQAAKWQTTFNAMSDSVSITDLNGNIKQYNTATLSLLNINEADIKEKKCFELVHGINEYFQNCPLVRMKNSHQPESMIFKEKERWLEVHVDPIFNSGNDLIGAVHVVSDITERKITEEKISQLSTAVEQSPSVIVITDLNGNLEYVNPKFTELTGYSKEEVIGKNSRILKSDEQADAHYKSLWETILSGKEWRGEFRNKKKNGELFWESASISPIFDTNGKSINYIKVSEDITNQKKTLNHLKESEEKFRKAFLTSPDSININRLHDGLYISVNNGFKQIMGYTEEEVIGRTMAEIDVWNDVKDRNKLTSKLKAEGVVENFEAKFKSKNGRLKDGLMSASLIELEGVQHILSITRDITERKRAEQTQKALLEIAKFYQEEPDLKKFLELVHTQISTVLKVQNIYVALYDKAGNNYTFPYYLDETDTHEGDEPENLDGSLTDFVRRSGKGHLINEDVEAEIKKTKELKLIGNPTAIWLGVPLLSASLKEVIGVMVIQDYHNKNAYSQKDLEILEIIAFNIGVFIERIQNMNDLTIALKKATESDRLKSAFLATMSHELRTPLNAIIGFSDIINEELTNEEIFKFCRNINSSGNHLLNIVEDLFDITLIESGKTNINKKEENLSAILKDIEEIVKSELKSTNKTNVKLELLNPGGIKDLKIMTDASKLKQIIINLVKNAIKFTDKGYIKYGYTIEKHNDTSFLKFFVEDTGIGIHPEMYSYIFDVFRQADDTYTRKYGGTGIGLSISKKLTELLGGKIWVESEINKGSIFYFTIPVEDNAKFIAETIEKSKSDQIMNKTILIVEDDLSSLEFLKTILEKYDIKILSTDNGAEAIKICKSDNSIDLVLMDINMPIMDGYAATKKIKEFMPDLPIIAQTAYAIAGDREKSLEAGCDDYISKPIKRQLLYNIIEKYLQN